MKENEAIKELYTSIDLAKMCVQTSDRKKEIEAYNTAIQALKDILPYRAIGTVEECRVAVERMKPRKLVEERKGDISFYNCPICNHILGNSIMRYESPYCPNCGTTIDWSE